MSSSLELNKIVGAILVAGLVAHLSGTLAGFLVRPHRTAEHAAMATGEGGGAGTAAPAPEVIEPVSGLLANADVAKGEQIAQVCKSCHSFGKGEAAKVGPNLYGIVGNKHAHMEGFDYSKAMASIQGPWTYEALDHFLYKPRAAVPGTKMGFAGLPKVQDRADVIAWLRTLSDNPVPLPTQDEIDAANKAYEAAKQGAAAPAPATTQAASTAPAQPSGGETQAAAAPADDSAQVVAMIAKADPAKGQEDARVCMACHNFDKDGPNKVGPNLWNVVGGPKAHMPSFSYSDAMKSAGGNWDYASLSKFLFAPRDFIHGTKMGFAGLKSPEKRAEVIAWLRTLSDNPQPLP